MMASEGTSKNEETFVIRRATSLDDLQWVIEMATEEGFMPREKRLSATFQQVLPLLSTLLNWTESELAASRWLNMRNLRLLEATTSLPSLTEDQGLEKKLYNFCLSYKDQCNIQTFSLTHLMDHHVQNGFQPGWPI